MRFHWCIDALSPSRDGGETFLRGWALGLEPIAALVVEDFSGAFHATVYGQTRSDLVAEFPAFPHAAEAGFSIWIDSALLTKPGFWWLRLATGGWHRIPASWEHRSPQAFELGAATLVERAPAGIDGAFADNRSVEERFRRWLSRGPRLRLRIDLINKCNLRCIMCHYNNEAYARKPMRRISLEEFKELFEPLSPYIGEALLSCADEPLLSPVFPEVLRYLAREHPHVAVHFCTNAMLMDERIRRIIVETGVGHVMVSIDGARKPTFERIRKGASFERVIRNIRALAALRDSVGASRPELQVNFVMTRSNIAEAVTVVQMARELGAAAIDFHHAVPTNSVDIGQERLDFHPALYNRLRPQIEAAARAAGLRLYLPEAYPDVPGMEVAEEAAPGLDDFHAALKGLAGDSSEGLEVHPCQVRAKGSISEEFPKLFCEMPFSELFIANQESLMPCPFQSRVNVPLEPGVRPLDVYFSKPFVDLRKAMLTPEGDPGCKDCPLVMKRLTVRSS